MRRLSGVVTGALIGVALLSAGCDLGAATPVPVAPGGGATTPTAAVSVVTPTARPMTKIVVAMGYIANVQFAPYYVAQDRGYYADEGLEVEFKYGQVNDLLKVVSTGAIDYANVGGDEMVPAVAQGVPVRYVLTQYYKYPVAAAALAGTVLKAPADLKGHKVGIPGPYGSNYIGLKALLKAGKLTESDIKEQSIGFTQVSALSQRQVDIAMVYSMNEPVQLKSQGKDVTTLQVSDYMDLAAVGVATSEKKIRENPEQVQAFVRATLRGTADTLKDPAAAFASSMARTPEITDPAQQSIQRAVLTTTLAFMTPPAGRDPGSSDPATWKTTEAFLREIGLTNKPIDPTTLYTNDFIAPDTH
ncbi:MAG: ABC transporter substrate-binding protein [Chloroflexia bacterium]